MNYRRISFYRSHNPFWLLSIKRNDAKQEKECDNTFNMIFHKTLIDNINSLL